MRVRTTDILRIDIVRFSFSIFFRTITKNVILSDEEKSN